MAKLEDILNAGKSSSGGSKSNELSSYGRLSGESSIIYTEPKGKPGGSMSVRQSGSKATNFWYTVYNYERLPPTAMPNPGGVIEEPNLRYGKKFFNRRDAEKSFESLRNTQTVVEL